MIKIKRFYINEKGSVLFITIMMTAILLLLGTTASIISVSAYKMRKVESVAKKNFHIAEAISQEAEIKLDEYVKEYVENSYQELAEYIEKNEAKTIDIEKRDEIFKDIFKKQAITLDSKIEDIEDYNLKIIEGYDLSVKVNLEDLEKQKNIEEFDISIISSFEDRDIQESIRVKYKIKLPRYKSLEYNKNLIEQIEWSNYKW